MREALEFEGLCLDEVNQGYQAFMALIQQADPKVELTIANSLWGREGVPFYEDFLERCRGYYDAEVTSLDFGDPDAPGIINGWVREATREKIRKVVSAIPSQTILYLINAIYFKGTWQTEFDEAKTRDRPFMLLGGTQKNHPTMHQTGEYEYLEGEGFQAVSLPYGENDRMSMYIFLPDRDSSLGAFLGSLDLNAWEGWMTRFQMTEVEPLALPRFKIEYEVSLKTALSDMGMSIAFDPVQADFSGMLPTSPPAFNVYINTALHKTFVEVNEEGTEAAAVTVIAPGATSLPPPKVEFVVDRPFFFVIRDNTTGTILFMGVVVEPM